MAIITMIHDFYDDHDFYDYRDNDDDDDDDDDDDIIVQVLVLVLNDIYSIANGEERQQLIVILF